ELTELPLQDPPAGHVRISVEACGICHTDAGTVEAVLPVEFPRVPGHEVVGRIDAVGAGVEGHAVGDRVGVGYLGGQCNHCAHCRRGDFVNCENQPMTGVSVDGGYADSMIARETGLVRIPEELDSIAAAPLLCAGLTTFNALRNSPARPGDLVAVGGVGGLGHLAIQYARHMGFRVAAVARGPEKRALAEELGAHHYIDSVAGDPAEALQALGGAAVIVGTAASSEATAALFPGLAAGGTLVIVGVGFEPLQLAATDLVFAGRSLTGSLTGSAADGEDALDFSALQGVRSRNEVFGLDEAPAAYARMMSGAARFRVVLDTAR
ncbi:MAG TPA: alcohol dehydrogenase catalytic domain-containing protein, partial [Solirubrobacterales bacterium]|nr:alcohol dehydrogenase catalytic domain-containing protein [Solirubrobacterales bacterium]